LLNGYFPQWVSVHDPDEYLASATTKQEEDRHYADILAAYRALEELKKGGKVSKIGIGAKNWNVIERISQDVQLDWVMFANSITVMRHPKKLMEFVGRLRNKGVEVINSAVFHSGFLVGTDYFDYKLINSSLEMYKPAYEWRERFFSLCNRFNVRPALACVQFSLKVPGINAIALNTTDPKRVKANIELTSTLVPDEFWDALKQQGLIDSDYPFLPF
jgi:D-threo-aldose 1-dehydrogenase